MKKLLISLLSVGMLLGIFGTSVNGNGSPNLTEEQTVKADTTNNSKTIRYEVYSQDGKSLSSMNMLFTKVATIYPNDDGTSYKVTLKTRPKAISNLKSSKIDGQDPTITTDSDGNTNMSFKIKSLDELNSDIPATLDLKTNLLGVDLDTKPVVLRFDSSSLDSQGTSSFADSLNKITNAENDFTNSANDIKGIVSDLKSNDSDNNILSTPDDSSTDTTSSNSNNTTTNNNSNNVDPKTILRELTYKIAKNNGDGSLISPYFTNTAKVMQNPDGSYYVETTIKYPKKFGTDAFEINSVNNQKPFNIRFRSEGDSNYLTFDFPIKSLTDLGNLIPGDIQLNIPDFGLNKDLGFNLDFDAINPSELSNLMSGSNSADLSDLVSGLGDLSNLGKVKSTSNDKNDNKTQATGTLPQTGNETNGILMVIGGAVLVMFVVLLKGTYFKN